MVLLFQLFIFLLGVGFIDADINPFENIPTRAPEIHRSNPEDRLKNFNRHSAFQSPRLPSAQFNFGLSPLPGMAMKSKLNLNLNQGLNQIQTGLEHLQMGLSQVFGHEFFRDVQALEGDVLKMVTDMKLNLERRRRIR